MASGFSCCDCRCNRNATGMMKEVEYAQAISKLQAENARLERLVEKTVNTLHDLTQYVKGLDPRSSNE